MPLIGWGKWQVISLATVQRTCYVAVGLLFCPIVPACLFIILHKNEVVPWGRAIGRGWKRHWKWESPF